MVKISVKQKYVVVYTFVSHDEWSANIEGDNLSELLQMPFTLNISNHTEKVEFLVRHDYVEKANKVVSETTFIRMLAPDWTVETKEDIDLTGKNEITDPY